MYCFAKKRRTVISLIIISWMIVFNSGCSQVSKEDSNGADTAYFNPQYAKSGMETVSKDQYDYDNGTIFETIGLGIGWSPVIKEFLNRVVEIDSQNGVEFGYRSDKFFEAQKEIVAKGSDDAKGRVVSQFSRISPNIIYYGAIFSIKDNDEENQKIMDKYKNKFSMIEPFADNGEYKFYYAYNDNISSYSDFTLSDEDKINIEKLSKDVPSIPSYSCLFPPGEYAKLDANMGDFSADTLDGGTFNQDDLAKYDLTMVNIWTTWCPYCIEEMPDLEKLYNDLPDNVNMVSLCTDANEELKLAKDIINQQNCSFKTLIPDEKLKESLLNDISAFPTTIFLDSQGNLVGKPQVGAPKSTEGVAAGYLEVIKERLELAANR